MVEKTVTVNQSSPSQCSITIPKEIVYRMNLKAKDKLRFIYNEETREIKILEVK